MFGGIVLGGSCLGGSTGIDFLWPFAVFVEGLKEYEMSLNLTDEYDMTITHEKEYEIEVRLK